MTVREMLMLGWILGNMMMDAFTITISASVHVPHIGIKQGCLRWCVNVQY